MSDYTIVALYKPEPLRANSPRLVFEIWAGFGRTPRALHIDSIPRNYPQRIPAGTGIAGKMKPVSFATIKRLVRAGLVTPTRAGRALFA